MSCSALVYEISLIFLCPAFCMKSFHFCLNRRLQIKKEDMELLGSYILISDINHLFSFSSIDVRIKNEAEYSVIL